MPSLVSFAREGSAGSKRVGGLAHLAPGHHAGAIHAAGSMEGP